MECQQSFLRGSSKSLWGLPKTTMEAEEFSSFEGSGPLV